MQNNRLRKACRPSPFHGLWEATPVCMGRRVKRLKGALPGTGSRSCRAATAGPLRHARIHGCPPEYIPHFSHPACYRPHPRESLRITGAAGKNCRGPARKAVEPAVGPFVRTRPVRNGCVAVLASPSGRMSLPAVSIYRKACCRGAPQPGAVVQRFHVPAIRSKSHVFSVTAAAESAHSAKRLSQIRPA